MFLMFILHSIGRSHTSCAPSAGRSTSRLAISQTMFAPLVALARLVVRDNTDVSQDRKIVHPDCLARK
jgi:hypothetical protein